MAERTDARGDNWVRVFISHKEEDKELAFATRDILEAGCNNLRCYVSGSGYSRDWLATIREELARADVLLLLFTSPAKQWDWPLYEVGLFTPLDDKLRPGRAIVYLYAGEQRPAPLEHLQGVRVDPANPEPLKVFLKQFYTTAELTGREPALLPRIRPKEIGARAAKLKDAFLNAAAVPVYPTYRVVLTAPAKENGEVIAMAGAIDRDCGIEHITPATQAIFGFAENPGTWGHLLDAITDDDEWKGELNAQYQRAIDGRMAFPTTATFLGVQDVRNFRAMITRVERADTRIIRIAIAFVPEHTPATVGGPAFNLLRLATRFKTEVIDRFVDRFALHVAEVGAQRAFGGLLGAIRNIEREAEALRYLDPATVRSAFADDGPDRETVDRMFEEWGRIRGVITECAASHDAATMDEQLRQLQRANAEFLLMISARHYELTRKDAAAVVGALPQPARGSAGGNGRARPRRAQSGPPEAQGHP